MTPQRFRLFTIDSLGAQFGLKNIQSDPMTVGAYIPQIWGGADQLVRRNLLLNTATLATQNVTVLGLSYTLYLKGTGSVTLSGAATGTLNGTGAGNRVSLQFTATAGTLTLTVSGSVTEGHLTRTATTDHSYQAITDWTTEVYAYNATRQLPWLRRNIWSYVNDFSTTRSWGVLTPTASELNGTITFTGSGNDYWYKFIGTAYPVGTVFTVSCEIKSTTLAKVGFGNADAGAFGLGIISVDLTNNWVRYKNTFTSISSIPNSRYGFDNRVAYGGTGAAGSIEVRNFQVTVSADDVPFQNITTTWPTEYTSLAQAAGYPISLYSDRAGTIAVDSAETVVGKMLDLSTKGNHLVAPSDAARPLLKRNGNGSFYLLRDLVDDSLNVTLPNYGSGCVEYLLNIEGTSSQPNELLNGAQTFSTPAVEYGRVIRQTQDTVSEAKIIKYFDKSINILAHPSAQVNDIGIPGLYGFGVGICPSLPSGFSSMIGTFDPLSGNYGNYIYSDGSVMCWIPAFFYRFQSGTNQIEVLPYSAFANVTAANAAGFALHRAFYDGIEQPGFFVDKYQWSANSYGGNTIASSIKNGNPLSSNSAHNPWGSLTGLSAGDNIYGGAIPAAKTRGANFACISRFQWSALAMLSLAHAQASVSATYCAWWATSGVVAPRGCDNSALASTDDTAVKWQSDGYSNAGKTGSAGYGGGAGNIFAKSAHNGQPCGVADLCGNMWEVNLGMTCIASTKTISAATQSNPCVVTATGHDYATGDVIQIDSVVGMTQLNGRLYTITVVDANSFSLDGINSSGFSAYSSAGTAARGKWYAAKSTVRMRDFTAGTSLATDHWGATGVAAMMNEIAGTGFLNTTVAANAVYDRRWGNGAAAAFRSGVSGANWTLDGLALCAPEAVAGGANLFGSDYYYQYVRDQLCLIAGGNWGNAAMAGVWALHLGANRAYSYGDVGGRAGYYL